MARSEQALILEPSELIFSGPYNEVTTSYFTMTNPTERYIIFKVKTTAPEMYCVKPNAGYLKPKQKLLVDVILQPGAPSNRRSEQSKNKLMLQSRFSPWKGEPYADWLDDLTLDIPVDIGRRDIKNAQYSFSAPSALPDLGTERMVKTKQYQNETMNVATSQVISLTSETMESAEQALILEPSEFHFTGPYDEVKTSYFLMTNPTERYIIFKVKTTAPEMYCIKPNTGYLKPKQKLLVAVKLQPIVPLQSNQSRNQLTVQSRYSPWKGEPYADWVDDLWKNTPPNVVMNSTLLSTFGLSSSTTVTQNPEVGRSGVEIDQYFPSVPITLPAQRIDWMVKTRQCLSTQLVGMNVATAEVISLTLVPPGEIDHPAVAASITGISTNLSEILRNVKMIAFVNDLQGENLLDASRNLCSTVTDFLKAAEPVTKENRLDAAGGVDETNRTVLPNTGEKDLIRIKVQSILDGHAKLVGNAISNFTPTAQNVALQCDDLMQQNLVVAKSIECALITSAFVSCCKDVTRTMSVPICQQQIIAAAKKLSKSVEDTKKACYDATGNEVLLNDVRQTSSHIEDLLSDFVSHIKTTSDQEAHVSTHDRVVETSTTDVTPTPICKQLIEAAIKVSKALEGIRKACNVLPDLTILPNVNLNPFDSELVLQASKIFPESLVHKFVIHTLKDSTQHFITLEEVCTTILDYSEKGLDMKEESFNEKTGASSSTEGTAEIGDINAVNLCKICMELQMGIAFQPCGHVAACQKCAELITNCPVCRASITSVIKIYLS